ncbi:hypothetical protein OCOL_001092 [Ordospora colligata]
MQTGLAARCQKYGISLNDCLNSVYIPKKEYDDYLQSFNMPIIRDSSCNKEQCVAVVYKDINKCLNCKGDACAAECDGVLQKKHHNPDRSFPMVHVIHHNADRSTETDSTGNLDSNNQLHMSYKSVTVIETKTETVSEKITTTVVDENVTPQTIPISQVSNSLTTVQDDVKTIFKTLEMPIHSEHQNTSKRERLAKNKSRNNISASVKYPQTTDSASEEDNYNYNYNTPEQDENDLERDKEENDSEQDYNQNIITVTRVFYKTVSVEKPITLYREVTTTVKNEIPVINYKLTTVKEITTETKTESSIKTETVTQTQYHSPKSTSFEIQNYVESPSSAHISKVLSSNARQISLEQSQTDPEHQAVDEVQQTTSVSEQPSMIDQPEIIYTTVIKPIVSLLTVTKIQDKSPCTEDCSSSLSPENSLASSSTVCEQCNNTQSTVTNTKPTEYQESAITTMNHSKPVESISASPTSIYMDKHPLKDAKLQFTKQDVVDELIPLIRKIMINNEDESSTDGELNTIDRDKEVVEPEKIKTLTKTVVKTVNRRHEPKTVYNTVYTYKKKPECRKGVEGRKRIQCHDGPGDDFFTTVYA